MKQCSVKACYKRHKAKGYCGRHYERAMKYGDPHYIPGVATNNGSPIDSLFINDLTLTLKEAR